ncbi:MAG: chemotaxis protein CheC [Magnetococcales bacterium]|nr:chemotaxis protein CheC [Magnetococcales bacterium]
MIDVLSELEQDALLEVLNLGMGQAADSLSRMVGDEVLLSVPTLYFLPRDEAFRLIEEDPHADVAAVRQLFSGPFQGSALLIYPHDRSLELVRSLLHAQITPEECRTLEQESLMEVGNIILNACLGTLANLMEIELLCDLPQYLQGRCDLLLTEKLEMSDMTHLLVLYVHFGLASNTVRGDVVLLFDATAIAEIKRELAVVLTRYACDAA